MTSAPYPFRFQMASMRRPALSSRHVGVARPRRIQRLAPLMLAPIRTLVGRSLATRCMMSYVRTRVLQSKVRPLLRTRAICAVTSKLGTSGTRRWIPFGRLSLSALRRISGGSNLRSLRPEAYRTSGFSFPSLKLPPLLESPGLGPCVEVRRPPPRPTDDEAARRVFWPPPPLPAFWHSCRHVPRSSLRGA